MSTNHVDLIVGFEGFHSRAYWDYAQWSVGYGSYAGGRDRNVRPPIDNISEAEGRRLLAQEIRRFERHVDGYNSRYNWTPNERAALISFAYNIGSIDQLTANGTRSKAEIAEAMLLYNKAGGETLPGLVRRRRTEREIFTGGAPIPPAPEGTPGVPTMGAEGAGSIGDVSSDGNFQSAGSLADLWAIAEQNGTFWENETDKFDFYTYNLELFVIDEQSTTRFLSDQYSLDDIMNDAWPSTEHKRVTIAKTGMTTEFNIQDLTVESLGTGDGSNARQAGQAVRLNFQLVQAGNTSLSDSLQNAAILMGYTSITDAIWYMKINFIGYTDNQPEKLLATKVLPFKFSEFKDVQTTTDSRGTVTVLNGVIIQQHAFNATINVSEYTTTFDIGSTLRETIENFLNTLNERLDAPDVNFTGDSKFVNTYHFTVDPEFEELYMSSRMDGPTPNLSSASNTPASRQNGLNISQQIAQVPTGSNVYEVLQNICIQATDVSDAMTRSENTFSDIFMISTNVVPKPGGLNILTNTRGYDVTYHFSVRRVLNFLNQTEYAEKVGNASALIDEIFNRGRCRKIYYYQYTGLNDQVLDFQVSLNKVLQKTYVTPTDNFIWANYVSNNGMSVDQILRTRGSDDAITVMETSRDLVSQFNTELQNAQTSMETLRGDVESFTDELRDAFLSDLRSEGFGAGEAEGIVADVFSGSGTLTQRLQSMDAALDGAAGRILNANGRANTLDELAARNEELNQQFSDIRGRISEQEQLQDDIVSQVMGAELSDRVNQALSQNVSEVFGTLDDNNDNLILVEELDSDFVTRLNNQQFDSLIRSMLDNPVNFRRVIIPNMLEQRTGYWRSSERELVELSRSKYYEGLQADLSMHKLKITIKGDPFWLNNYITPQKLNEIFTNNNTLEEYRNYNVEQSGQNYCMIVTNKAAGTDENDNIKIANLMIAVYAVKSVTSSFTGGQFVQTLDMVKMPFPAEFRPLLPELDATFESLDAFGGPGDGLGGEGGDIVGPGGNNEGINGDGNIGTSPIGVPTGATGGGTTGTGNGELQPGDGPGGGNGNIPANDPLADFGPANISLMNALSNAQNGPGGFPSVDGAVQLAYAMNQMRGICGAGVQAACDAVSNAERNIIGVLYQIGDDETTADYVGQLNDAILSDPDFTITPEGIAILNQALINQGREPIDPNDVIRLDAEEVESFNEAVELDMQRYYLGTDDIVTDSSSPMVVLDPSVPGGAFAESNARNLLESDSPFDPRGSSFSSDADATGMEPRTISTEIPPNTLTPVELEAAVSLQRELQSMVREKPLTSMSDSEYARAKQLESAISDIVDNATTGTRGEIRDEIIQREKRSELAQLENDLSAAQAKAEGFHWTAGGALEDAEQRDLLKQQVLEAQVGVQPDVLTEVKKVVNPETGSVELLPTYEPSSIDRRPITVPKTDPLPIPAIDNGDGTMTIEGPPSPKSTITDSGLEAVDATSLTEEQKQQYYDAIASNNSIKVTQFVESLSSEQQDEILALENTQGFIKLPGSEPAQVSGTNVPEQSAKELDAAFGIYENVVNQVNSLPTYEKTFSYTNANGITETWTEDIQDFSQMKDVKYMDSTGAIKTIPIQEIIPVDAPEYGWTAGMKILVKRRIAQEFETITAGDDGSSETTTGGPMRTEVGEGVFSIIPIPTNEEETQQ